MSKPLDRLKHHVTGAIQCDEKTAIKCQPRTNLDLAREIFPKADFYIASDRYELNSRLAIEWLGDGENFVVIETVNDRDSGACFEDERFSSTFAACLEWCRINEGIEK